MNTEIRALGQRHISRLREHLQHHWAESGRGGNHHFMPFDPDDPEKPKGLDEKALTVPLDHPGWQRWWVACLGEKIVGFVYLKGNGLKTGLHRCDLGIGIERPYRGVGIGRALLQTAIDFAHKSDSLAWIDLRVFSHNTQGIRLYRGVGFSEIGVIQDCFRIDGQSIDDMIMVLPVGS